MGSSLLKKRPGRIVASGGYLCREMGKGTKRFSRGLPVYVYDSTAK